MMKDKRYGGSNRLRSPSPCRRGFFPHRGSRIGDSSYSSPRGRCFDADEDRHRREGRYSIREEEYKRHDDKHRSHHYESPGLGGTRLSDYDDAGGRDRQRDMVADHSRRLYQPTSSDGDRGRSFGRGSTRLSGYDASGRRDRDKDMEADYPRLYQPTSRGGDHVRNFGRGSTRLSGYDASVRRDRDKDKKADYPHLYQPISSGGDRGRNFGHGSTRLSDYDASGRRDRDKDTKADYPRLYQPVSSGDNRGSNFGRGGTRLSDYDATGRRDIDKDAKTGYPQLYQPTSSDCDRGRNFGHGGTRLSDYDASGRRDIDKDAKTGYPQLYQPISSDCDRGRSFGHGGTRLSDYDASGRIDRDKDMKAVRSFGRGGSRLYVYDASGGSHKDKETEANYAQLYHPTSSDGVSDGKDTDKVIEADYPLLDEPTASDDGRSFGRGGARLSVDGVNGRRDRDKDTEVDYPRFHQPTASDGDGGRSFGHGGTRLSGDDASGRRDGDRDTETNYQLKIYRPGGYGEDSQKTHKYGDTTSRFQWDDPRSSNGSKDMAGHWPEGSRARNEADYDYRSNKFVDDNLVGYGLNTLNNKLVDDNRAGYGLDTNHVPVETEKERLYSSSSYQMDVGTPAKSSSYVAMGDSLSLKDENFFHHRRHHLEKLASDKPLPTSPWSESRGAYRDDNLSAHFRPDIDMMKSSSRSKASDVVPSGSVKSDIISSSRDLLPPAEVRLSCGSFNDTGRYNEYGSKSRPDPESHVDHDCRSAEFWDDSLSHLGSTKERFTDCAYPDGGQGERVGMGTRSSEAYRKIVDVLEGRYGPHDVSSMGTLEPIVSNAEGYSDQGYLRGNRLSEPLTKPMQDNYDAHKLVETNRQEVKSHHYGSSRSQMGKDSYNDHGISRSGELNIDHQYCISWSSYKQSDKLPPEKYGSVVDNFEHRQGKLILDKEKLPKQLKRTFIQRGDVGKEVHRYGGTWNDIGDSIEQPWRDDMDTEFRLCAKSKFGKANNVSILSSKHHFSGTGSVSEPSHYSNISNHRDIKKRLGPVSQKLHVSQRLVKKYKPSLMKRLGPGPQNNDAILPPWLRKRKAPQSQRVRDGLNEGFVDQGGEPQEDDFTPTKPQEDDVTQTKREPPENSEDFKQMVSNAFFKFVKQLNETPAKRRKYLEHINAGSLKCIVCGSVSDEFGDTESLGVHAFKSQKVGVRSQHLGLHKALCVLMGWKIAEPNEATWICESISRAEHLSVREDLILWPPVVIVHNTTIGNQDKGQQVIFSVQELEEKLREMGFGEKMKVHLGKPENESVMVVQFGATFSGLQEAERLHNFYLETRHGRDDFEPVNGDKEEEETEPPPPPPSLGNIGKLEDMMYGYMGIAEDMHLLDFGIKRRCLVKSKRDILLIAQALL